MRKLFKFIVVNIKIYLILSRGLLDDPTFQGSVVELSEEPTPYFGQLPREASIEGKDEEQEEENNVEKNQDSSPVGFNNNSPVGFNNKSPIGFINKSPVGFNIYLLHTIEYSVA